MSEKKIEVCPYCNGTSFGIGYQVGQGCMASSKMGFSGCKIIHTICRQCGTILQSKVEKPSAFKEEK